jgi:hypothetical protein
MVVRRQFVTATERLPMIYTLLNTLLRRASGRECRRCGEAIIPADPFGVSEGVCSGCRR